MSDTPETDAHMLGGSYSFDAEFARSLERQRNVLLDALERLANHGHADDCLFLNRANESCDCGNDEAFRLIASVKRESPCVGKKQETRIMKQQIEQLKKELQEFLELEKLATKGPWKADSGVVISRCESHEDDARLHVDGGYYRIEADSDSAEFIATSRNISPAMAKMLLVHVTELDCAADSSVRIKADFAHGLLQQILSIWEGAKRG
jgi:hypothetical protein